MHIPRKAKLRNVIISIVKRSPVIIAGFSYIISVILFLNVSKTLLGLIKFDFISHCERAEKLSIVNLPSKLSFPYHNSSVCIRFGIIGVEP